MSEFAVWERLSSIHEYRKNFIWFQVLNRPAKWW